MSAELNDEESENIAILLRFESKKQVHEYGNVYCGDTVNYLIYKYDYHEEMPDTIKDTIVQLALFLRYAYSQKMCGQSVYSIFKYGSDRPS